MSGLASVQAALEGNSQVVAAILAAQAMTSNGYDQFESTAEIEANLKKSRESIEVLSTGVELLKRVLAKELGNNR